MASPSAAWRPWPTCSGPVGLAETNSTSMRRPFAGSTPKRGAAASTSAHDLLLGLGLESDVEEAGAGDVDGFDPAAKGGVSSRAARRLSATWRGLRFSGLASCIAAVQARSPWAATLGDSNAALSPAPGDSRSSPAARLPSNSFFTRSMGRFYGAGLQASSAKIRPGRYAGIHRGLPARVFRSAMKKLFSLMALGQALSVGSTYATSLAGAAEPPMTKRGSKRGWRPAAAQPRA